LALVISLVKDAVSSKLKPMSIYYSRYKAGCKLRPRGQGAYPHQILKWQCAIRSQIFTPTHHSYTHQMCIINSNSILPRPRWENSQRSVKPWL